MPGQAPAEVLSKNVTERCEVCESPIPTSIKIHPKVWMEPGFKGQVILLGRNRSGRNPQREIPQGGEGDVDDDVLQCALRGERESLVWLGEAVFP